MSPIERQIETIKALPVGVAIKRSGALIGRSFAAIVIIGFILSTFVGTIRLTVHSFILAKPED
jgi:hypothetical protein